MFEKERDNPIWFPSPFPQTKVGRPNVFWYFKAGNKLDDTYKNTRKGVTDRDR